MGRYFTLVTAAALAVLTLAACDIPRDPRGSLTRASGDTLRVGVTEARPWVERVGDEPRGVEPQLIRGFARSIDATIEWSWGSAEEHMEALRLYELDVVIGGFTRATPWRKHVGLTQPYHVTRFMVAGPPGTPPLSDDELEGRPVRVRPGGPLPGRVRKKGAEPRLSDTLHADSAGLVAAADWELAAMGRDTTGVLLSTARHVMAVPAGENALLMALENALHAADVAALLARVPGGAP